MSAINLGMKTIMYIHWDPYSISFFLNLTDEYINIRSWYPLSVYRYNDLNWNI